MKKIIYILFMPSMIFCDIYQDLLAEGNKAMINEKYEEAITVYESILELGNENSDLYYNLGNAYYRLHYIGQAIWAYMNALRLNPRDRDIYHNLSVAKAKRIDRIDMPESVFILKLYRFIKAYLTIGEWILLSSILVLIQAIIGINFRLGFQKNTMLKIILTALVTITISTHCIVFDKYFQKIQQNSGVVIANGVDAYSRPFYGENTVLFKINEGSIVDISNIQKDWLEIILIDGKKGWVILESIRALK